MFRDYQTLGLPLNATKEEVKHKFKHLAKQVHPDKKKYQFETAHAKFIKIRKAYDNLNEHFKQLEDIFNEEKIIEKTKKWYKNKQTKKKERKKQKQYKKEEQKRVYEEEKKKKVMQQQMLNEIFNNTNADDEKVNGFKYKREKIKMNVKVDDSVDKWNMLFMKLNK